MIDSAIYFVGTPSEVGHHMAPLGPHLPVRQATCAQVMEQAEPGDLAVFYSEHFDRFRHTIQELRKRRVATLYMIDGILEWRNAWDSEPDEVACPYTMRPALADKVACIGNSQARVLEGWGNEGKTEIVGIPRLDRLQHLSTAAADDDRFRLLVMTAKTPAFTEDQHRRVVQSLKDLRDWLDENPRIDDRRVDVTWRLTRQLDEAVGVTNKLDDLSGQELVEVLQTVDAVVTTPSTAMLEAMLLDRPVALLDYHQCPSYVQSGWVIASAEGIEPALMGMVNRDPRRLMFQRSELDDALQLQTPATGRMVDLIKSMLRVARFQMDESGPLRFAAQLLDRPAHLPAPFVHRDLYPNEPEFAETDTLVLQTELSHARREIQYLQSQQRQLRSELQQAHDIFESINRHPIAGPIVRIRQRILDWMERFGRTPDDPAEAADATAEPQRPAETAHTP